jgi:hypothetical protein
MECWNISNEITVNESLRLIQYKLMYEMYYTRDPFTNSTAQRKSYVLSVKLALTQSMPSGNAIKQMLWAELQCCLSEVLQCTFHLNPSVCIFISRHGTWGRSETPNGLDNPFLVNHLGDNDHFNDEISVVLNLAPCTFTGCCHIDPVNVISALRS